MLGDIRSAKKLLISLDVEDMDSIAETRKSLEAAKETKEVLDELVNDLEQRVEYLKVAGQEEELEDSETADA